MESVRQNSKNQTFSSSHREVCCIQGSLNRDSTVIFLKMTVPIDKSLRTFIVDRS